MQTQLTKKAAYVLGILIEAEKPMIASEIVASDDSLNINTVQNVLRSLMKSGYIEVADIVYSGNVLCRSYRATAAARQFCIEDFANQFQNLRKTVPVPVIFSALIDKEMDDEKLIKELEEMINKKKEALAKGDS